MNQNTSFDCYTASARLTRRESEILGHSCQGRTSKDIADCLFVSKRTIDYHMSNIYAKLSVSNRVQAFRKAAELGLIPRELTL